MSRHRRNPLKRRAAALLGLALAALAAGFLPADEGEAAVRRLLDEQSAAWNRKDLDGFCSGYWNSPLLVFQSGGDRSDGFEAMRERYRRRYQGAGKEMGTLRFEGVEVVTLGADAALARGGWGLKTSDGKAPSGLFTLVLRRFPEGWRIVHDHTSSR